MTVTQVRLASAEESISRARRSGSAGQWLLEKWYTFSWARGDSSKGYFVEVSAHLTEDAASKAKAKLDRKIAKIAASTSNIK